MNNQNDTLDVRLIQSAVRFWRRRAWLVCLIVAAVFLVILLLSGIYTVPTNQTGALFTFGELVEGGMEAGIHYKLPAPIQRVALLNTTEVRRMQLSEETLRTEAIVTGDENLIEADVAVQFQIHDFGRFLIGAENWKKILAYAVETALTEMVAQMPVDVVLTTGKNEIQVGLRSKVQESLDAYGSGLVVIATRIVSIDPPAEAATSFRRVADAKSEKAKKINEAQSKRSRSMSKARGNSEKITQEAKSDAEENVKKAQGETQRYLDILKEYRQARQITRQDLYYKSMEKVLQNARVLVLDPNNPLELNLKTIN